MTTIDEVLEQLKTAERALRDYKAALLLPVEEDCDLMQAATRLRNVLGANAYLIIGFELTFNGRGGIGAVWNIYHEKKFFDGSTLARAINAVLAAQLPPPTDPVADVQLALPVVEPMPF